MNFGSLDDVTSGLWEAFQTGSQGIAGGILGGALGSLDATLGTAMGSLDNIFG